MGASREIALFLLSVRPSLLAAAAAHLHERALAHPLAALDVRR